MGSQEEIFAPSASRGLATNTTCSSALQCSLIRALAVCKPLTGSKGEGKKNIQSRDGGERGMKKGEWGMETWGEEAE